MEDAGVKYDKDGVKVNDHLQTSNNNIFAVGDICTKYKFTVRIPWFIIQLSYKHVSDSMARIVIQNALFFGSSKFSSLIIPWSTYTDPGIFKVTKNWLHFRSSTCGPLWTRFKRSRN